MFLFQPIDGKKEPENKTPLNQLLQPSQSIPTRPPQNSSHVFFFLQGLPTCLFAQKSYFLNLFSSGDVDIFIIDKAAEFFGANWRRARIKKVHHLLIEFFLCVCSLFWFPLVRVCPKLGSNTMGQESGPAVKVAPFNPGSRLKEKRQDEALHHWGTRKGRIHLRLKARFLVEVGFSPAYPCAGFNPAVPPLHRPPQP